MQKQQPLTGVIADTSIRTQAFEWDTLSWARAARFWERSIACIAGAEVLELGANNGGLSLLFALAGARVTCTDLNGPTARAIELHARQRLAYPVTYKSIEAGAIAFPDGCFDVVVFKSMLGAVARNGNLAAGLGAVAEIHRVLKPGGQVFFAENLAASRIHRLLRRRFVEWGSSWNYLTVSELRRMFDGFERLEMETWGFCACWGRTNQQRKLLYRVDQIVCPVLPETARYIAFGSARKSMSALA